MSSVNQLILACEKYSGESPISKRVWVKHVMKIVVANLFSPVNCKIKSWRTKVCLNYCWGNVGDLIKEVRKSK